MKSIKSRIKRLFTFGSVTYDPKAATPIFKKFFANRILAEIGKTPKFIHHTRWYRYAHVLAVLTLMLCSGLVRAAVVNVNCYNNLSDAGVLNMAISHSQEGDQINIHGTCLINQTIVLRGKRSYVGDVRTADSATQIQQADRANLPAMLASDSWYNNTSWAGEPIQIAHIQINGNKANNSADTVGIMMRSWQSVIEDVKISQMSSDGIRLSSPGRDKVSTLSNTMVNGQIINVFIESVNGHGINTVDTGNNIINWRIVDSWIAQTGQNGIYLGNATGWLVLGIHLYNIGENAIFADRCWNTTIIGNYVEDFGGNGGNNAKYGIACTMQAGNNSSMIADNKVSMIQAENSATNYRFIGVPAVNYAGTATINVVNNAIVGNNLANEVGLYYSTWCACGGGTNLNVRSSNNVVNISPNTNPALYQPSRYVPYGTLNFL